MNDTMDLDVRLPNDGEHEVRTVAGAVPVVAPAVPVIVGGGACTAPTHGYGIAGARRSPIVNSGFPHPRRQVPALLIIRCPWIMDNQSGESTLFCIRYGETTHPQNPPKQRVSRKYHLTFSLNSVS